MNTRPEPRMNVLGHVVTKHVKDGDDKKPSPQLSGAPRLTAADANRNIAEAFVRTANRNMDYPEKVSDNLGIYEKLFMETSVGQGMDRAIARETALRSLREDNVFPRLRDAFLKGRNADINDPDTYAKSAAFGIFVGRVQTLVNVARKAEFKLYGTPPQTDYSSRTTVAAAASVPNTVAWDSLNHDGAQSMLLAIDKTLDDPKELWKNMSLLKDALGSSHGEEAVKFAYDSPTMNRLADSWIAMHDADITRRDLYQKIEGPDGYQTYRRNYAELTHSLNQAFVSSGYNPFPEDH